MALLGTLVDNFRGDTLNTALWNAVNSPGNAGFQAGNRYTFIVQQGATGDASLVSDVAYDLTGSHVHVHLIEAGVQETGLETYPIILSQSAANNNNSIQIVIANGLVGIYQFVAGVPNGMAFVAYNAAAMQWWRVRELAGVIYIESAPKVQGPWTVRASGAPLIAITALFMKIRVFDYLSLSTAKQAAITDVNYLQPLDPPFPNGELPMGMEMAFGADIYGDQTLWDWTDVSDRVMSQTIAVTRGRQDESSDVTPTEADATLDNPDGWLTPDNPMSGYYPDVDLGTPARIRLEAPTPRLSLVNRAGANAAVDHVSQFDVTGDIDIRLDIQMGPKLPTTTALNLAGVYDTASDERAWRLLFQNGGYLQLQWSPDGTFATVQTATSTAPVVPTSARRVLRATLDVNNGAGGWTATFYLGESMTGPWTQIGPTVTGTGTTSIYAADAPLEVGAAIGQASSVSPRANVYGFQLRDGINGTLVADANFTEQTSDVPAFVDPTGLVWNVAGDARLTNQWYRIVGTADSWEPRWPWGDLSAQVPGGVGDGQARVDTTVAGILRRLGQGAAPLQSALTRAIVDDPALQAFWPMEDLENSQLIASGIPGGIPAVPVAVDFADNDTLLGAKPLATLTANSQISATVVGTFTGQWQLDWYIFVPSSPAGQAVFMRVAGSGTVATWLLDLNAGSITVTGYNAAGSSITSATAGATEFFGRWLHVRLFARQVGPNIEWFFVWFPVVYPPAVGYFLTNTVAGTVGGLTGWSIQADADLAGISMGEVAVLDAYNLDTADNAGTGWTGDTAVERMARLCREQGVSLLLFGTSAESALMGPQPVGTLLDLLSDAKEADGGILYEQPDAVGLIYRTRASLYNQVPNIVFDALQNQIQNPFSPILDDQRIRNDVTVTRQGGSSVQVVDQASIDKNGTYDESVTLNLYQDSQLSGAAGWRLHQGTVKGMRYAELTTNLGVAPEMIDAWLTVDTGARAQVINLPPQHPTAVVDVMIEGYQEPFSPTTWEPVANCSPGSVWTVGELDGTGVPDEYLLRLDSDASELDSGISDVATSMDVLVTEGPEWVTSGSELPLDVRVGGERITVTAIGAAVGGVQTFTIVRSVNGVVKSHEAGSPVELWFRPVLAR